MGSLSIITKYELKSFKNYLLQKKSRLVWFIISLLIELGYIYVLFSIIKPVYMRAFLSSLAENIVNGLTGITLILAFFSFSAGSSLIVTVRKGIKSKIDLFLLSPSKPERILFIYLFLQSLAVTSLITEIILPALIWFLFALNFDLLSILIFALNLILVILSFSFTGALTALAYTRLGHRKRMILSIVLMSFVTLTYLFIYGYNTFRDEINLVLGILNSEFSPFRWFVFALYLSKLSPIELVLQVSGDLLILLALIIISFRVISYKLLNGELNPPVEIFRYDVRKGIIGRLFRPPIRGLLNKEIRNITREPLLLNSLLFGPIMIIVFTIIFILSSSSSSGFFHEFAIMTVVVFYPSLFMMLTANYYSVSLAVERRALAIILSSPTDPAYLVKSKSIILLLVEILTGLGQVSIISLITSLSLEFMIMFSLFLALNIILSIGLGLYIGVKYVNLKADNPRRALDRAGSIIMLVFTFIIVIFQVLIIVTYYFLSKSFGVMLLAFLFIASLASLKFGFDTASSFLRKLEITDY